MKRLMICLFLMCTNRIVYAQQEGNQTIKKKNSIADNILRAKAKLGSGSGVEFFSKQI